MVLTAIATILGILATVLAYKLNPKQKIWDELDALAKQLKTLYSERDNALEQKAMDRLAAVVAAITELHNRQSDLLKRLREITK